jgi:NADH dehydrogenase
MTKHICILGGGFGGLYTALSLSKMPLIKSGYAKITLVEQKDHFLFTPLLYELITGELQRWQIAPSYQKLLHNTPVNLCQDKVVNIDINKREISLENHPNLSYDYLVLGLGTQNRYASIPGITNHALKFRTLEDLELLNQRLHLLEISQRQRLKIAVIGGGPNGVELACKLADRLQKRGEIYLIQRTGTILKGFPQQLIKSSQEALEKRRILAYYHTGVEKIEENQIILNKDNEQINLATDLVIWTAGTQCLDMLKSLPCEKNYQGKLIALSTLQLANYPEVFALGDLADIPQGKNPAPAKAQAAYQQADYAAANIHALLSNKPLKKFRYLHLGDMMTVGNKSAIVYSFGLNITGYLADVMRRLVYIQRLPTTRHRLQVFKHWFGNSFKKRLGFSINNKVTTNEISN